MPITANFDVILRYATFEHFFFIFINKEKKKRCYTKKLAKKIRNDNFTISNGEKHNIAIAILGKRSIP